MAITPITNKIDIDQFRDEFAKLLQEANDNFFVSADVQIVNEEHKILEAIKRFRIIRRVLVVLHPSNPDFSKRWEKVDARMHKMEVAEYRSEYKGKETGMKLPEDDEAYQGIEMAVDGYGHAEVIGVYEGETVAKTVRSSDSPVQVSVFEDADPERTLSALMPTFRSIWQRMSK